MNEMKGKRRRKFLPALLMLLLCLLWICAFAGCGQGEGEITTLEQLNKSGRRIGVGTDTAEDKLVKEYLPEAEIEYFKDALTAYTSVSQGKVDAFVYGKPAMQTAIDNGLVGVKILEETLGEGNRGAAAISPATRIPDLKGKINAFLKEIKADGTLDDMRERWMVRYDQSMPEIPAPDNPQYHLVVGTTGSVMPFTYYVGTTLAGYDIELAYRFAAWLGATVEFKVYDFNGIVEAAQNGSVDCIFSNLYITPEREEAITFSDPTYVSEVGVMVQDTSVSMPEYQDFSELAGKTVSMLNGVPFESLVLGKAPDVAEFTYYNNMPDMALALRNEKTDAMLSNNAVGALTVNRSNGALTFFPQSLDDGVFGFAFAKGDPLRDVWQAAYETITKETKQALWEKWTGSDESAKTMPEQDWPGSGGTVQAAVCDTLEPMSYIGENGQPKGFDLEMILLIAKELDVHVEFTGMDFPAIMASVQSGKATIGAGSIIATAERREAVDFVDYYPASFVLLVRSIQNGPGNGWGFFASIKESFEKTFIREDRWKLFVSGIVTTLIITFLSIVFGTALGFGVYMLCRKGFRVPNQVTRFCVWLIEGMPVVVLLMILYYVVFSKLSVSGTTVAVIAFTLIFGAGVFGMLQNGVGAVDKGQREAALALGYTDRKAFYRHILPQAMPIILPSYRGQLVSLIKSTSVVGYVAVQDLTKMGDIVRSRTFEAFFPLIAVAIIYFILAGVLVFVVNRVTLKADPTRRKKEDILKGVTLK